MDDVVDEVRHRILIATFLLILQFIRNGNWAWELEGKSNQISFHPLHSVLLLITFDGGV